MLRASGRARGIFFELAGMQDKQKGPPAPAGGPSVPPSQNGTSSEARSGVAACAGTSASARFNRRTALARTLQEIANFAVLAFLGFPLSRSYLELTSCPSKRTRSPLCSVSAMDSPRRLKATRCRSTFETHSSSVFLKGAAEMEPSSHHIGTISTADGFASWKRQLRSQRDALEQANKHGSSAM